MRYVGEFGPEIQDLTFAQELRQVSRVNFDRCYQCSTCTLGCPLSFSMDFLPHQIIRMAQLGLRDLVLKSNTIWLCAACQACFTRCPHGVDLPRVMDVLCQMAAREKVEGNEPIIPVFHKTFLKGIKRWGGRQHELSMLLSLKLRTRDFLSDMAPGMRMLLKGKLKLIPARRLKGIERLFNEVKL